jgi:hypothetical protein
MKDIIMKTISAGLISRPGISDKSSPYPEKKLPVSLSVVMLNMRKFSRGKRHK